MRDFLISIQKALGDQPPTPDLVRSVQQSLEGFLKQDDVDMDTALKLTPLVQALDRLNIKIATESTLDWVEVKSIIENLLNTSASSQEQTLTIDEMDLLLSFIQEAKDHLAVIDQLLLKLETEPGFQLLDDIFRPMHTIKGVASFLNLPQIQTLAHVLENRLDYYRKQGVFPQEDCLQIMLDGKDTLELLIDDLAQAAASSKVTKGRAQLKVPVRDIDPLLQSILNFQEGPKPPTTPPPPVSPKQATEPLISADILAKFHNELSESLDQIEKVVLQLETTQDQLPLLNDIFRQVHTIKGNAGFLGLSEWETQAAQMEEYLDDLRNPKRKISTEDLVNHLLTELDNLRHLTQQDKAPQTKELILAEGQSIDAASFLGSGTTTVATGQSIKKEVRIDTEKLDKLFDLIGELIIAQSMVLDDPVIKQAQEHNFNRSVEYLRKITRELQTISMNLRMIPLEGLFNKMHRLVRDLTKKVGKNVQLKITGQETEMDRNIIEQISDPLIHLIRNALDHGIEPAQERLKKGKRAEGLLHLSARYAGNEIIVELHDDGRGLQRQKILNKALSQKLLSGDTDHLSDQDVWALIFEPGFSTATNVTEISGRGVGMDVVKKNIEKLRGRVTINSVENAGTTISLHIPLTLAILDGITFRAGDMLFALATTDVQEFQNFDSSRLHHSVNNTVFYHLRQQTIPYVSLRDFYKRDGGSLGEHPVVLIIQHHHKQLAVLVDEVVGTQQIVMKGLPDRMRDLRAVGGCTVMGNGEVCLILDTQQLFKEVLDL